jgi:hypothetical protein
MSQWFRLAAGNELYTRLATGVMNLAKPRFNMDVRRNFFTVPVTENWNSVPDEIKIVKNTWQFKKFYRSFWCSRPRH